MIPRHILLDVPLSKRKMVAIQYRIDNQMIVYSTIIYIM